MLIPKNHRARSKLAANLTALEAVQRILDVMATPKQD